MLPYERRQRIYEYIETKGSATVSELSKVLSVSEMTIRRDLKIAERDGAIKKTFGGAVSSFGTGLEPSPNSRRYHHLEEKQQIAQRAIELIDDGDTLIFDCSTTVFELASLIKKKKVNLTIVTCGPYTVLELSRNKQITVISTGGIYSCALGGYIGPETELILNRLNADKLFFSCFGVSIDGLTDPNVLLTSLKRQMFKSAKEIIFLADYSKFGKKGLSFITEIKSVHKLITDKNTPIEYLDAFKEAGVEALIA